MLQRIQSFGKNIMFHYSVGFKRERNPRSVLVVVSHYGERDQCDQHPCGHLQVFKSELHHCSGQSRCDLLIDGTAIMVYNDLSVRAHF